MSNPYQPPLVSPEKRRRRPRWYGVGFFFSLSTSIICLYFYAYFAWAATASSSEAMKSRARTFCIISLAGLFFAVVIACRLIYLWHHQVEKRNESSR